MTGYQATTENNSHGRSEELQWARILSSGDPARGMILLFVQKLCTAFHEFEPAWRAGTLKEQSLPFFREQLARRITKVLAAMKNNDLDSLAGFAELEGLLHSVEAAQTMDELASLSEKMHTISHTVSDSLEGLSTI